MKTHYLRISSLIPLFVGALSALAGVQLVQPASAQSQLQTLLTADFAQTQDISGVGLVTGLSGTGDAKGNFAAATLYAQRLSAAGLGNEPIEAINRGEGVALVMVTAKLPNMWSDGMSFDCQVVGGGGGASSLEGGRLWTTPLKRSESDVYRDREGNALPFPVVAFAGGWIEVPDAENRPLDGRIREGARSLGMPAGLREVYTDRTSFNLQITKPAFRTVVVTKQLVDLINDKMSEQGFLSGRGYAEVASMQGDGMILINIPDDSDYDPLTLAAEVLSFYLDFGQIETPAEIRWSRSRGTLTISANTELLDTAITVNGLTIQTVSPESEPTIQNPRIETQRFIAISGTETPRRSLLAFKQQLDRLMMPTVDQAAVLQQMCLMGRINGRFVDEDLNG
ncbi:MAG: flagellar basal body P-ring protein FlgI [Phycisphaerales bacterium]|jgi:flagellar basal body P-ring protein FlgI|nr:flagellar basal body P-ring protein FlgI [Phycisphaerales bacterium]